MAIHGTVSKGFERVRDAFEANFREGGEVGAAFCLHVKSRKVVDLWGGLTDVKGKTWKENTPALVFSTTKGATAICAMMLVDQKRLDIDAPVAQYWPEFAARRKSRHSGADAAEPPGRTAGRRRTAARAHEVLEVTPIVDALAKQTPVWPPGSRHGYHALTYGWLVGEVVRRITGKTIGRFFKDEVAEPLGLDFWIGLPADVEPRVARLVTAPPPTDPGDSRADGRVVRTGLARRPRALAERRNGGSTGRLGLQSSRSASQRNTGRQRNYHGAIAVASLRGMHRHG